MPTIVPPSLSPQLPAAWDTPENKTAPSPAEIDHLLLRKVQKPAWSHASDAPMTLDPVTHKPMVDPVLCSDGKVHDRINTRPLPYLDRDTTGAQNLQVLGHDRSVRAAVHTAFPAAKPMLALRTSVAQHINDARSAHTTEATKGAAPANCAPDTAAPLAPQELLFRQYQLRQRSGDVVLNLGDGLTRTRKRPQPLSFSRNTFSKFNVLPDPATGWRSALKHVVATPSQRLVDHLASHGVLQGSQKSERLFGCMEFLEPALNTFKVDGRHLTETEKEGVRKYLRFFERQSREVWETAAELEHTYTLLSQNEHFFRTSGSNQIPMREREAIARHCQHLMFQIHTLKHTLWRATPQTRTGATAFQSLDMNVPAPKRTQSLQNLRLIDSPEVLDPDLFYCPLMLETAPAPVLCSDGNTYDLSQLIEGNLTTSPLTREPMHMIGRHEEKQLWAAHLVSKQDADFFQQTYDGLSKAYGPKSDGLADRLINYQRRRRSLSRSARPDTVSVHIFQKFAGMSHLQSEYVIASLTQQGIINRAQDRSIAPTLGEGAIREALVLPMSHLPPLTLAHQSRLTYILSTLLQEQTRRQPLVAKARHLSEQLPRLPKDKPRYAEIKSQLEAVDRELHKLPSGRFEARKHQLY